MVEIDGSYLEGGGAILRVAAGLSAVTGRPLRVSHIRAGRKNPGLRVQHLEGLKAIAALCSGRLVNARIRSTEIELHPGAIEAKELQVTISTAGSIGLLFQSLKLPICMAAGDVIVTVNGGATFAKWAPPVPYIQNVLLPVLGQMGYSAEIEIQRHGFYPIGGAETKIVAHPCRNLQPLSLTDVGVLKDIRGMSIASEHLQKPKVAERQAEAAMKLLRVKGLKATIESQYVDAACPGSGIVLWVHTSTGTVLGFDALGERGKPSELVGEEAARGLINAIESGAAVDNHLSDMLLIFIALARGKSAILCPKLTDHAKTNMYVIEKFLPVKFQIAEDRNTLIECSGSPPV